MPRDRGKADPLTTTIVGQMQNLPFRSEIPNGGVAFRTRTRQYVTNNIVPSNTSYLVQCRGSFTGRNRLIERLCIPDQQLSINPTCGKHTWVMRTELHCFYWTRTSITLMHECTFQTFRLDQLVRIPKMNLTVLKGAH